MIHRSSIDDGPMQVCQCQGCTNEAITMVVRRIGDTDYATAACTDHRSVAQLVLDDEFDPDPDPVTAEDRRRSRTRWVIESFMAVAVVIGGTSWTWRVATGTLERFGTIMTAVIVGLMCLTMLCKTMVRMMDHYQAWRG